MNKKILTASLFLLFCFALSGSQVRGQAVWGVSIIAWDDPDTQVAGLSGTYLDYYAGYYYDPWVNGCLYSTNDPEHCYSQGQVTGYANSVPAEVYHPAINTVRTRTYCTYSDHRVWSYYYVAQYGNWWDAWGFSNFSPGPTSNNVPWYGNFTYIYRPRLIRLGWTQACHYVPLPPTPTPTPTPTATPTPLNAMVNTVSFAGNYPLKRYIAGGTGTPISNPTWQKNSTTNAANPVAYTKGKAVEKMKLSANFAITPNPGSNASIKVRVKYSGNVITQTPSSVPLTSSSVDISNLGLTSELEATPTAKKGNYTFDWEVSFDNGNTWSSAGSSEHPIYWTFEDVLTETSNCSSAGDPRDCLFINRWGQKGWSGLYDKALEEALVNLTPATQTPDAIAKFLAFEIDRKIDYNAGDTDADYKHPLDAYDHPGGVECSVNANLLRGLLRSIGINNSDTVYVWGGKPDTPDKKETGGVTHAYQITKTSLSTGASTIPFWVSFQAIRPASNEGMFPLPKDPHFTFHAMVKIYDTPNTNPNNLLARYYDPSYGKRLAENMANYMDYPYINNDLQFRKAISFDGSTKGKFVKNEATKPYVVRDFVLNSCLPNNGNVCDPARTRKSKKTENTFVAAHPRTSVFDDQGLATFTVWRPSDGVWYTYNANDEIYTYTTFGTSGDRPVPADYDGDGKSDYAVFRPSNQTVYIMYSETQTLFTFTWNSVTDLSVIGDYDGDGKNDIAFYRSANGSHWYIRRSSDGVSYTLDFGDTEDKPVTGDFDGDGKTDLAVYRPSTGTWWWWSSTLGTWNSQQFGISEDIPTPGDYDGDGKTDFAVYRPSTNYWYFRYSSTGYWGQLLMGSGSGISPVPADYDGDAITDAAVWQPSTGVWTVKKSSDGTTTTNSWGGKPHADQPAPAAYIHNRTSN